VIMVAHATKIGARFRTVEIGAGRLVAPVSTTIGWPQRGWRIELDDLASHRDVDQFEVVNPTNDKEGVLEQGPSSSLYLGFA
jgi:hypothetical protein